MIVAHSARGKRRGPMAIRLLRGLVALLLLVDTIAWHDSASADSSAASSAVVVASNADRAEGSFSQSTTVSPASIAVGGSTTIQTTITGRGFGKGLALKDGIADIEIYNAANQQVAKYFVAGQQFAFGLPLTYSYTWTAPNVPGAYTVIVGVFGPNWNPRYLWTSQGAALIAVTGNKGPTASSTGTATKTAVPATGTATKTPVLATITVTKTAVPATGTATKTAVPATGTVVAATNTATQTHVLVTGTATSTATQTPVIPTPTLSSTPGPIVVSIGNTFALPNPVAPGASTVLNTTITANSGLSNIIVDFEVFNALGTTRVFQTVDSPVTLAANTPKASQKTWVVPITLATGSYKLKIGVFSSGWTTLYKWNDNAGTITVGSAATATATLTSTKTPAPPSSTVTMTVVAATSTSIPSPVLGTSTTTSTPSPVPSGSTATATVAATTITTSLPVPTSLAVQQDDRAAILTWNGQQDPPGVTGYKITWGPAGGPLTSKVETAYRIIELQPLVNGQNYQAEVQAVDALGNLSALSPLIAFTGDPSRINALRTQMTGFFDDFNNPQGPFDELKWNTAYSHCDIVGVSAVFINAQFHSHDMLSAGSCDRSQVVSRPRAVFDFTGRTGTITFDMDGGLGRNFWYVDLMPSLVDITSQVNIDGNAQGYPGNMLRFRQNGQNTGIFVMDSAGNETLVLNSPISLDSLGLSVVPNVRRHWVIHISRNHADMQVNGQTVVTTDSLNLPFTKAYVHWTTLAYNNPKENKPDFLLHWDNFGFDGPPSATETHNYQDANYIGGGDFQPVGAWNMPTTATTAITIPDSLAGATAERLMFTMQMDGATGYVWDAADTVSVNGHVLSIPKPTFSVDGIRPYSEVFGLPLGTLTTGVNSMKFYMKRSGVLDVHAEVDFPAGHAPAYTQPDGLSGLTMAMPAQPQTADVGPGATINSFNSVGTNVSGTLAQQAGKVYTLKGITAVSIEVTNHIAMEALGKNPGISSVQLWVDSQEVLNLSTNGNGTGVPSPHVLYTYNLDTRKFSNGNHTIYVRAFNPSGTPAIADYFLSDSTPGADFPLALNIAN